MTDFRTSWADLLRRRPSLASALEPYRAVLDAWARAAASVTPLSWGAERCRAMWDRETPLIADASPILPLDAVERLLEVGIALLESAAGEAHDALARFSDRWNAGAIRPADLLPATGRIGSASITEETGLGPGTVAFLALVSLRPWLEQYFAGVREHLPDRVWHLGVCPFCGAPAGFADVVEDGRRALACHFCGGSWASSRTRCPYCGSDAAADVARLALAANEEGYVISACTACSAYVKELDRRARWNGGPALVEDWGSPHFDVAARRKGYWRPVPSLIELTRPR
jgi:formate dehydrogenase formation protein